MSRKDLSRKDLSRRNLNRKDWIKSGKEGIDVSREQACPHSCKTALERLPEEITKYFSGTNLMIIFPDQHGDSYGDQ